MYSIERKAEIMKILEKTGRVEVNDLYRLFETSRETIRRDLREMEVDYLLKRTHGGAVSNEQNSLISDEFPVNVREIQNYQEKDIICRKAASFIQSGDSIFVDNSSTCLYLLNHIPTNYQVTIITNSIKLLVESARNSNPNHIIVCLGGLFHGSNLSLYGNITLKNASEYYPNKAFMSCAGIHLPDEVVDSSLLEVDTKRLMIERSHEVFILADNSKFEKAGHVFLSNFNNIDWIITDHKLRADQIASLEKAGINMVVAQ
jgi:DeoR family fructose operon transcriptional repressor